MPDFGALLTRMGAERRTQAEAEARRTGLPTPQLAAPAPTFEQQRQSALRQLYQSPGGQDSAQALLLEMQDPREGVLSQGVGTLGSLVMGIPGGLKAGAQSLGLTILGAAELAAPDGSALDRELGRGRAEGFQRMDEEAAAAEARAPGLAPKIGRGAGRVVGEMLGAKGLGAVGLASGIGGRTAQALGAGANRAAQVARSAGIVGGVAPITASSAENVAARQGLEGTDKLRYILGETAIESGFSALFPGGAERVLGKLPVLEQRLSHALKEAGSEVAEESATNLVSSLNGWLSLPENQGKNAGQIFQEWVTQLPETAGIAALAGGGTALAAHAPALSAAVPAAVPAAPALPPPPDAAPSPLARAAALSTANMERLLAGQTRLPLSASPGGTAVPPGPLTERAPETQRPDPTLAPADAAQIRARVGAADAETALVPRLPPDPYPGLPSPDEDLREGGFIPRAEAPQAPARSGAPASQELDAIRDGLLAPDPETRAAAFTRGKETPGLLKTLDREGRKDPAQRLRQAIRQARKDADALPAAPAEPTVLSAEDAAHIPPPGLPRFPPAVQDYLATVPADDRVAAEDTAREYLQVDPDPAQAIGNAQQVVQFRREKRARAARKAAPAPAPAVEEVPTRRMEAAPAEEVPTRRMEAAAAPVPAGRPSQSERLAEVQDTLAERETRVEKGKPVPLGATFADWKAAIEPQLTATERTSLARKQKTVTEARERLRALTQARTPNEARVEAQRAKLGTAQDKLDEARAALGWTKQHDRAARSQDNARRAEDRRRAGEVSRDVPFEAQKGNKASRAAQSLAGRAADAAREFKTGSPEANAGLLRKVLTPVLRELNNQAATDPALKTAIDAAWAWQDANVGFGSQEQIPLASLPVQAVIIPESAAIQSMEDAIETRETVMSFVPHVDPSAVGAGIAQALAIANEPGGSAMTKAQRMAEATGLDTAYTLDAITTANIEGRPVTIQDLGLDDNCGL